MRNVLNVGGIVHPKQSWVSCDRRWLLHDFKNIITGTHFSSYGVMTSSSPPNVQLQYILRVLQMFIEKCSNVLYGIDNIC